MIWSPTTNNGTLPVMGDATDSTAVTIDGWTTGQQNFIKVYTPVDSSEVGTSQRHDGKWDDERYRLVPAANNSGIAIYGAGYIKMDGLQILVTESGTSNAHGIYVNDEGIYHFSNLILKNQASGTGSSRGIYLIDNNLYAHISNSVFYDFVSGADSGFSAVYGQNVDEAYIYNNTFS